MKPIPSLLVCLMLICVALVSYDGGKRQARREAIQAAIANAPAFLITSNTVIEWSIGDQLRDSDGEVVLELAEWAYTETVWTNKDGYSRSVIESDGEAVIRTNRPAAPTDELVKLRQQIEKERQMGRKATFEAGFYAGRLAMTRHIKTNGVTWPYELSMQLINASTNELKAAWDEFNK